MKRFSLAMFFLLISIGLLSAAEDKLQLKGKLGIINRIHPELTVGTKVYELQIPRFILKGLNEGEEISVEGTKATMMPENGEFFSDTTDARDMVSVTTISARGKTVDVSAIENMRPNDRKGRAPGKMNGPENMNGNGKKGMMRNNNEMMPPAPPAGGFQDCPFGDDYNTPMNDKGGDQ